MIKSVDKGDVAYCVFLDGVQLTNAFYADDVKGEVVCYARNEQGKYFLNADRTEAMTETLRGVVEIVPMHCKLWYAVDPYRRAIWRFYFKYLNHGATKWIVLLAIKLRAHIVKDKGV